MMGTDLKDLKELAEAATPGPWIYHRETGPYSYRDEVWPDSPCKDEPEWLDPIVNDVYTKEDAKFIATANPQKVLEILDALRAAERERDELREHVKQGLHAIRAAGNAVEYEFRSFEKKAAQEEAYVRAWEIRTRELMGQQDG
jgi:hypothetical protein